MHWTLRSSSGFFRQEDPWQQDCFVWGGEEVVLQLVNLFGDKVSIQTGQASLEVNILSQAHKCWDYKCAPAHLPRYFPIKADSTLIVLQCLKVCPR